MKGRPRHPMRERARQMRRQGSSLTAIAEACRVSKVSISRWCRDMPEHQEAVERNTAVVRASQRIYPAGTRRLVNKLLAAGIPAAERLRLAHQAAATQAGRSL